MPTYEYEREDGTRFELEQRISEDALLVCPSTGQKVRRVIHAGAFQLKGSGWYKSDYASPAKAAGSKSEPSSGGEASSAKSETASSDAAPKKGGHSCAKTSCGCG